MRVVPFTSEIAADVAAYFNEAISDLPHCFPVAAHAFGQSVGGLLKHTRRLRRLEPDAAFVAYRDDRPAGFVHCAPENTRTGNPTDRGVIRFISFRKEDREAGQALLDEAHNYLERHGSKEIVAFKSAYRYPFYHQLSAGLSDHWDHVQELFQANAYRRTGDEIHLEWGNFEPQEPPIPSVKVDIEVIPLEGEHALPGLHLKAFRNGMFVGECGNDPYAETRDLPELQDWFYIGWLGIEAPFRGKGLGKYLLLRSLVEMHALGYRHATLSCAKGNKVAFALYAGCGFRIFDRTAQFMRSA